ncbi:carbohydrate-binding protein [Myxococcota bacterium]|nr:carbohydrate-binding protein [Myxococcota bacterium]MBU1536857.1 carbohydrate-binding protein [Myxococcota bacterium]
MRKQIVDSNISTSAEANGPWLDIDALARVEITSEESTHPIEAALIPGDQSGWRAAFPGEQTIKLLFDAPQLIQRIWLQFEETQVERTQEFLLRWSADKGETFREIMRQQWNFSPAGSTQQKEELHVELHLVTVLELTIIPNISGGGIASLKTLRIA